MILVHYIEVDYADGSLGGVARFDSELKKIFPDMYTCTKKREDVSQWFNTLAKNILFIVANDLCIDIPAKYKCIVVQHGCAAEHMKREPDWNGQLYVARQALMVSRPNNFYISISEYTSFYFYNHLDIRVHAEIIHWSTLTPSENSTRNKKVVLGDWRNYNKGEHIARALQERNRDGFEYRQLECGADDKAEAYADASMYLTLSLSEGCSYSHMDALACDVPILSTKVSIFHRGVPTEVGQSIEHRNDHEYIEDLVKETYRRRKEYEPRSWYLKETTYAHWTRCWKSMVKDVYTHNILPHVCINTKNLPTPLRKIWFPEGLA